jgi:hypothetical protein
MVRHVSIAWGSIAEWVSGLGALAAAGVALWVSWRGERAAQVASLEAQAIARDARRAAARDRVAGLLVQLVHAVERDIAATKRDLAHDASAIVRSAEATALCRALWGRRNAFGTVWHVYCELDQRWTAQLWAQGELFPQMRTELQNAIDQLDHEDR